MTLLFVTLSVLAVTEPQIELVTMGQGPQLFARFGHAAICVVYRERPLASRCYNYGTADFQSPPEELGWRFLRGTATFWVSVVPYVAMVKVYQNEDRSVWRQLLPFDQAQVDQMVGLLAHDHRPENRSYNYHHFDDNCATRLRDHIDTVTRGALGQARQQPMRTTFREVGRRGIADQTLLVGLSHFFLGRRLDHEINGWEAMFHPDHLRGQVQRRLGTVPQLVYQRQGQALPTQGSQGLGVIALGAVTMAAVLGLSRLARRGEKVAIGLVAGVLFMVALAIWLLAVLTTVPEMRINEALCLFLPSDALLFWRRSRQLYVRVRLVGVGVFALLLLLEVFIQPLWVLWLIPTLTCAALLKRQD